MNSIEVQVSGAQGMVPCTYKTVVLKPNIVDDKNILTQAMMNKPNTKYIIKYDFIISDNIVTKSVNVVSTNVSQCGNAAYAQALADYNAAHEAWIVADNAYTNNPNDTTLAAKNAAYDALQAAQLTLNGTPQYYYFAGTAIRLKRNQHITIPEGCVLLNSSLNGVVDFTLAPNDMTVYIGSAVTGTYEYTIQAGIEVPVGCLIEFDGGSISDGVLVGNNTILIYDQEDEDVLKNIILLGDFERSTSAIADKIDNINGMAKIYLKKNKPLATQLTQPNTIYVIQYDFTLDEDIAIPANCVLEFDGGSISGEHTITGANTGIQAGLVKIFSTDVTIRGTWNVEKVFADWFGVSYSGQDESSLLQNAINQAKNIGRCIYINGNIKCDTDIIVYSNRGLRGEKYSSIDGNIVFDDTYHNASNEVVLSNLYANNITLKCLGFARINFIRCKNFTIAPSNNADGFGFNTLDDIFCSETFTIDLSNGWCNDNIFNKICANVASAERYGLRIEGNNGVTKAFHNNFFNACDFSHNKGVYSESLEKNTFTGLYLEDATINGVHIFPELNGRWNILGIARYNNSHTVYENSRDTLVLTSNSGTPQYIPIGTNILKQGDFSHIRWNDKLAYKTSDNSAIGDLSIRNDSPTKVAYRITGTGFDFKIPIGKIHSNSLYITLITKTTNWTEAFSIQADEDVSSKVYFVGADKDYDGYKIFTAAIDTLNNTDFNKNWYIRGTCSGNKIIDIAYIGVSESSIIYPTIGRELVYDSYIQGSGDIAAGSYLDVSIASLSNDIQVEDIDIVVNAWPDSTNYVGFDKCIKKIIRTLDTEHNTTTYKVRFENNTAGAIWAQFTGWAKIHILREYTRY